MLSLNVRTPVHENNHTSHRVQDPSLIRIISQHLVSSPICSVEKMVICHLTTLKITKNKFTEKLSSSTFSITKSQLSIQIQHNFLRQMAYFKFVKTILRSAILRSPSIEHVKNGALSSHQQLNHNRTCDTTIYHIVWNFMGHAMHE